MLTSKCSCVALRTGAQHGWHAPLPALCDLQNACVTEEDFAREAAFGQKLTNRLEALDKKKPLVAAVDGSALGGGLEVVLACGYRIASSSPKTKLGLPEVMLGLLPGAGGCQRLPQAAGIQTALTMATTGKQLNADRAKKAGVVHAVADPHALLDAGLQAARGRADGSFKVPQPRWKSSLATKALEGNPLGRAVLFNQAEKMIKKQAGTNYPAPMEILNAIKAGAEGGLEAGLKAEREGFGRLGVSAVSDALRGVFASQTATKKNPFGKPSRPVKKVAVLGAGLMGAGIAEVSAAKAGVQVLLKDKFSAGLARGEAQIQGNLDGKVKKRRMTQADRDAILSRVHGLAEDMTFFSGLGAQGVDEGAKAAEARHLGATDVLVEAVFEDLGLKHKVLAAVEPQLPEHAVFATNTSAIPIADIAKGAKRPGRVLGMHYFSPVDKMPLLEVITHDGTDADAAATAVELGYKQGKTVIVVKDVPGFYVNRSLTPFLAEGVALIQEGVDPKALDKALTSFGWPVGPVKLMDEVGIDVATHVATFMSDKLENRTAGGDMAMLQAFLDAGITGRKGGKGYYDYTAKGKSKPLNPAAMDIVKKFTQEGAPSAGEDADTIAMRMTSRFVIEAVLCLQHDIIRSPGDGDIGAIFGVGFPPFRGGPFRWVDQMGAATFTDKLKAFAEKHGDHFAPPQLLLDLAAKNGKFHPSE